MTLPPDSTQFDSYVPVYDAVPRTWDEARPFMVEQFKKISDAINIREIGWYLDEELLSGKQFVPSSINDSGTQGQFRSVFRKLVDVAPLSVGVNTVTTGIFFDANFSLIDMWVAATNTTILESIVLTNENVTLQATTFTITSPGDYNIAWAIVEYLHEP
jgi:hypothetical protein